MLAATGKTAEARANYVRAVSVYRAVVAADESDIVSLAGLAQASDAAGDLPGALAAYERAAAAPGLSAQERAGIQNNLAYTILRSPRTAGSLDRARALVTEAVAALEAPAFLDTLGSIEAARGDRGAAIRAYTRVLELDRSMHGSRVELAAVLATGGTAEDRAKARSLLDEASRSGSLNAEQKGRAEEVRAMIEKPK